MVQMYGQEPVVTKPLPASRSEAAAFSNPTAAPIPKLVLLCELGDYSAEASIELSRSSWAVTDRNALPKGKLSTSERRALPCIGLVMVGADVAAVRRTLEELDDILPTRFLWLALLPSGSAPSEEARALIAEYCFDFFTLPINWDYLAHTLGHALGMLSLSDMQGGFEHFLADRGIVGESEAMRALLHGVRKVAQYDEPLMVVGEPGTGKTLAARAVHARSLRTTAPFVAVNCASYTPALLADALFGAAGGGAAQGGTLMLNNVHDLPPDGQQVLLRILEEKVYVDSQTVRAVDVRIICATAPHSIPAPERATFNPALFHRLNILSLHVPALRERTGDLHLLARYFLNHYGADTGRRLRGFTKDAQSAMAAYHWPGNVRELMGRVRRAIVMCEGRSVTARDLGLEDMAPHEHILTLEQARHQADISAIQSALARHRNRLTDAARDLGVSRVTLYRLLERYRIRPRGPRPV
ncbi:MAG: sigma 54-interacting transcriptional regulator [Burkholderiaceae bacterium]